MRIFLTGATGYIGSVVAEKLQTAGHTVLGLAHSEANVTKLLERGIEPLRGDLYQPESLVEGAKLADAVIHTAQTHDYETAAQVTTAAVKAMLAALAGSGKPFIFTSGSLVVGNTEKAVVTEETPLKPAPFLAWLAELEQEVLNAAERNIRTVVMRATVVYGRGGSMFVPILLQASKHSGTGLYLESGENLWPTVHVDDLANAYLLALEKAPVGTLFNIASNPSYPLKDIAEAISRNIGAEGKTESWPFEKASTTLGFMANALLLDQQFDTGKVERLLGWQPSQPSVLHDIEYGSYREASLK